MFFHLVYLQKAIDTQEPQKGERAPSSCPKEKKNSEETAKKTWKLEQ